jgi:hypothetical protein
LSARRYAPCRHASPGFAGLAVSKIPLRLHPSAQKVPVWRELGC